MDKRMERKLRKKGRKLLRWARKNGIDRVDIYVNAESGFMHCYTGDGSTACVLEFMREE